MEDQIILIDKPSGISSFGVVAKVRRSLSEKFGHKVKVGHTGTLDPFATGLLILLSGKMTKKSGGFLKLDKVYDATLCLGFTSTTGDPEGEILPFNATENSDKSAESDSSDNSDNSDDDFNPMDFITFSEVPTRAEIEQVLKSFTGEIEQTVPTFSAVKINGVRAYKLARAGRDFTPPTRKVEIYQLEILDYHYPELELRCHVSSGTYIRSLAADLGEKLKTGAYLTALRRLKIGNYDLKNAQKLSDFTLKSAPKSDNHNSKTAPKPY